MFGTRRKAPSQEKQDKHNGKLDELILEALSDTRYKARTLKGIAKHTGKKKNVVLARLRTPKLREQIKVYPRRSRSGEILITTKAHFDEEAGIFDKVIDSFGSKHFRLDDVR